MNRPFYGAASITCSQRSEIINPSITLGPGAYDLDKQKNYSALPKWTLKPRLQHGSCFKIKKQNVPPPGTYEVQGNIKHKVTLKNPNYRSDKHKQSAQKITHLSHLHLPSSISVKVGASFGFRDQSKLFKDNSNSPGPIYNVDRTIQQTRSNKIKNSCRGFGFGPQNNSYKLNQFVPGPGAYTSQQKFHQSQSPQRQTFGKSERVQKISSNPLGPGQYNPASTSVGKSFKLKGKLPGAQVYCNPNGPGTYDLPSTKCKIGPKFTHHCQKTCNSDDENPVPDPFTYQCQRYPQNIKAQTGYSLGKRLDREGNQQGRPPGPGTYKVAQNIEQTRKGGYMGRKISKNKKNTQDDCFAKYNPKFYASAREGAKFSFASEAKPWDRPTRDQTIGPAYYQVPLKRSNESYSMGTSQRFTAFKKETSFAYRQQNNMNSTIGFLPSYMKKK